MITWAETHNPIGVLHRNTGTPTQHKHPFVIALEVLQNITSYLRRHVVQIELVLVTALTAVARKVIVLPSGAENKPQLLVGLGIAVVSLSAAYWLVKRANATPSRKRLGRGGSATKLDFPD